MQLKAHIAASRVGESPARTHHTCCRSPPPERRAHAPRLGEQDIAIKAAYRARRAGMFHVGIEGRMGCYSTYRST